MQMMENKNEKKTDPRPIVESELCSWQVPILKLKVDGVYSLEFSILCPFHPVSMKAFFPHFNHLMEQYFKVSMSNGIHAKRSNTGTDGSHAYVKIQL